MGKDLDDRPVILVVDDDAIMRDLVADWLEAAGFAVRKLGGCYAGAAATHASARPALVVSDMWMPGLRGADAIRWIHQRHPGVPLIAVSGHFGSGQGCSEKEALEAGAARVFAKPVKRAALLDAVAELIGLPPE